MTGRGIHTAVAASLVVMALSIVATPLASATAVPAARAAWLAPAHSKANASAAATESLHAPEQAIRDLVNLERERKGLEPLAVDVELIDAARLRAAAQVDLPRLSHYDADGRIAIATLLADSGLQYSLAGENLVRLWGDLDYDAAWRAHEALMLSPGHRANVLERRYNRVAIGAAVDGRGYVIFAEIFRSAPD